ncbi:MAG: putative transcriptional regulator [Acidimicrobiales bacterium]|jgi:predicted transcriptional regulator
MKTSTFTSTISPQLLTWMTKHASATKQTRRAILEEALTKYRAEEIRKQMQSDFKRTTKDKQTLDLSEWGMDDYHEIVTS